jgi:outer membrane protein OmpA-like peptidoglycan-associated protein
MKQRHGVLSCGLRLGAAVVLTTALVAVPAGAQESCANLRTSFASLVPSANLPTIIAAARRILDGNACDAPTRRGISRAVALVHLREAEKIPDGPNAAAMKLKLLESGMQFAQHWQLMSQIGALREKVPDASGRPNRSGASLAYQAALADISSKEDVPNPPPANEIQKLVRLAQQTRMLSSEFVRGDVLMTRGVRDVAVEAVAVPVQYVYNSDEMTPLGRQYADEALKLLTDQGRPNVALVGHTDPKGGDQFNVELSRRRAAAFKRFLVEKGYPAASIETDGLGKSQPLQVENQGSYTQDEFFQMLRRVEVKFK